MAVVGMMVGKKAPPPTGLLSVLENWDEVLGLVLRPGQRYKGEGGPDTAASISSPAGGAT